MGIAAIAALIMSCGGTQTYSGPKRSNEQIARLKENPKQYLSKYSASIWEVNGMRVNDATFGIDVKPGPVRVTVHVKVPVTPDNPKGYKEVHRRFTAKAGHQYIFEMTNPKETGRATLVIRDKLMK